MLVRAGINQAACVLIALVLWAFSGRYQLQYTLGYSLIIGNLCWLFIDGGRELAARWRHARRGGTKGWPGWGWMLPIVLLGTLLGYVIGIETADALFGFRSPSLQASRPTLLISLLGALGVCYVFYARESLHVQRLEAEEARRLASEVQLKLLQSQLEPHMLFNTLANLRVLIGTDPPRAQAMLDHLNAFLRATLTGSRRGSHPLAAEFDALRDYLALMAVRMGPRLAVQFELPPELRQAAVPPLLLQPLVENAIKHGLEPAVQGGRIELAAHRQGSRLLLTVRDTGVGLPAALPAADDDSHFGLQQVRQRLVALYGGEARLTLAPADDGRGGTVALIELPLAST